MKKYSRESFVKPVILSGISLFLIIFWAACTPTLNQPEMTQMATASQPASLPSELTSTPIPLSEPIKPIQLAWFWNSPRDELALPDLAENYDFFVFTAGDEDERSELINRLGSKSPVLQYMLFNGVGITEDCETRPYGNQIANQPGDYCDILNQHPNWLLYDNSGAVIYNNDHTYVRTNPDETGWREFFARRLWETQQAGGWRGVFLDNVDASLERSERIGLSLPDFPSDAYLQAANEEMLAYLYLNIFEPAGLPMYANIVFVEDENIWYRYLNYLDGAMIEDFAVGWNNTYKTADEWEWQMNLAEGTQALGKSIILVSQGEQQDIERETFAFTSYLLINQGQAFFRYTNSSVYNQLWQYDNYQIDPGQPLGGRFRVDDFWQREFEKATIIVNPNKHTSQIIFK